MRLRCGDELFEVQLREAKGEWEAVVNGQPLRLSLRLAGEGRCVVQHAGEPSTLHFVREGGTFHLFWDGVAYRLRETREDVPRRARQDTGALEAPMPGRVSAVKVAVGQRVTRGEELLIVEAMKMENALRAPRDGVVRAVHASVGEMVAPGRALLEIGDPAAGEGE
jgi:3-methylcrotonyl-CoA carboxylase alpha subunit